MTAGVVPLPDGFRIALDPATRQLAADRWIGGSPTRALRLTARGRIAWRELSRGPVASPAAGAVARRFTDAGLAHPVPPPAGARPDVTVVIPVRDRAALLARCLAALGGRYPTLVVDDGSREPAAVARVAADHGATLIRRPVNGGAGAARNTGLAHVTSELVAFVDSDCAPGPDIAGRDWIDRLAGHFADPAVAAVAPRISPLAPDTWAGRYTRAASSLDLGDRPARVVPNTRVSYVPTAALIVRRSAGAAVVFDETMRIGEDVDLVWRLHRLGWRIRYDPSVRVGHHEPETWPGLLARRRRYGTSAAPLAIRHPGNLTHLVLRPWPALTVAALLARRPLLAAGALAMAVESTSRTLRANDIPTDRVPGAVAATGQTWLGIGQYATQFAAPLLLAAMLPGGRHRWGRRAAAGSLLLAAPLAGWVRRRPALDPVRYTLGALADDIAYGSGVWAGCLAHRTTKPLRPVLGRRTETREPS